MRCQECELRLANGEADASVKDHLLACAACRALQEELQANALALSSLKNDDLPRVRMPERRPALARPFFPWIAAAAAGGLLGLVAHQASQWRPIVETPSRPRQATAFAKVTAKLPPEPAPKPPVHHRPRVEAQQPML